MQQQAKFRAERLLCEVSHGRDIETLLGGVELPWLETCCDEEESDGSGTDRDATKLATVRQMLSSTLLSLEA